MGAGKRNDRHGPARQRGSSAVEFALIFSLFFIVMYGSIAYGIVFALKHSLTQAANEGARAALQDVGDIGARETLASNTAAQAVAWLGGRAPIPKVTHGDCPSTPYTCLTVSLSYNYGANPIIPPLPGLHLSLPTMITSQATVQLI